VSEDCGFLENRRQNGVPARRLGFSNFGVDELSRHLILPTQQEPRDTGRYPSLERRTAEAQQSAPEVFFP
jgi:hypothetical protein